MRLDWFAQLGFCVVEQRCLIFLKIEMRKRGIVMARGAVSGHGMHCIASRGRVG